MPNKSLSKSLASGEINEFEVLSIIPVQFAEKYGRKLSVRGILSLIEHFGGGQVYIPVKPLPKGALAKVLSLEDQMALCKLEGGGNLFDIPSPRRLRNCLRNKQIVAMREQGISEREVAKQFGMSGRWIRQIVSWHRQRSQ